jgi:hypothetical protein
MAPGDKNNNGNGAAALDAKVSESLKQAVYAFASFGSAEPRVDLDGKVRTFWRRGGGVEREGAGARWSQERGGEVKSALSLRRRRPPTSKKIC